jgi:hypothetical protein
MRPSTIVDVRLFRVEGEGTAQEWEDQSVRALDRYPERLSASDPLATERIHDEMLRVHRHGRAGLSEAREAGREAGCAGGSTVG